MVRCDLKSLDKSALTVPNRDVEAFDLSNDGLRIVAVANENGTSRIHCPYAEPESIPDVTRKRSANGFGANFGTMGRYQPLFNPEFIPEAIIGTPGSGMNVVWDSGVVSGIAFRPDSPEELGFALTTARSSSDAYSFKIPPMGANRRRRSRAGPLARPAVSTRGVSPSLLGSSIPPSTAARSRRSCIGPRRESSPARGPC